MALFCPGKLLTTCVSNDMYKPALKCGFYCNPYLFCCFSSTFNYLSEILDSDQKALSDERPEDVVMRPETFIIDPFEVMAADLRYRQSQEKVKVKIPKRGSDGKVVTDENGKPIVKEEVEMIMREVLYRKYGMGVGMEDKMVKKKFYDAHELAWGMFFRDGRTGAKWMCPAMINACCMPWKDYTQLRMGVENGDAFRAGCCGEVGFFNTKRKPDFQMIKHGHPDELVVIMSCPGDHHAKLASSQAWKDHMAGLIKDAENLQNKEDKKAIKKAQAAKKAAEDKKRPMTEKEQQLWNVAAKLQPCKGCNKPELEGEKVEGIACGKCNKLDMKVAIKQSACIMCQKPWSAAEAEALRTSGKVLGNIHSTFEEMSAFKYTDGKVLFCPIQMCECRDYGVRGRAVQDENDVDLWKAYWLAEVKRGIAAQYSDDEVKSIKFVAILGGGVGAAEERTRLKDTLEILNSRIKLQGIVDTGVADAACCMTCGATAFCGGTKDAHGKRLGKSGCESGIVLAEAAARRVGFCMPFKNIDMDIAFVMPNDLESYLTRQYAGGKFDTLARDKEWARMKDLFTTRDKKSGKVIQSSMRFCLGEDWALLEACAHPLTTGTKPGTRLLDCGCSGKGVPDSAASPVKREYTNALDLTPQDVKTNKQAEVAVMGKSDALSVSMQPAVLRLSPEPVKPSSAKANQVMPFEEDL